MTAQKGSTADWTQHSVIVALISGAATAGFFLAVVVPIYTQSLRNEITAGADSVAKARATEERVATAERKLKVAEARIFSLENANSYSLGNPYPVGLGLVKVGQDIADVAKMYPGATIEKKDGYWSLKDYHSIYSIVTYYFKAEQKISHILLSPHYKMPEDFVPRKLTEILGPPASTPRDQFARWVDSNYSVFVGPGVDKGYLITRNDLIPGWWPDKAPITSSTNKGKGGK